MPIFIISCNVTEHVTADNEEEAIEEFLRGLDPDDCDVIDEEEEDEGDDDDEENDDEE